MKRLITMGLALSLALACTACAEQKTAKTASLKPIQISSVKWDEVAAASSAAHVTNNNLIMMR